MKKPTVHTDAALRESSESVQREDESRRVATRRHMQADFVARGLRSSEEDKRTGIYHAARDVHAALQARLDASRKRVIG